MVVRRLGHGGEPHTSLVLCERAPLIFGKSTQAQLGCAFSFFPTLRERGHQGICVTSYIYGRAFLTSNAKAHLQHHQDVHANLGGDVHGGKSPKLLYLMDWVVRVGCALHDCSNAVMWSLYAQFKDAPLLRVVYCVIASVRNNYDLVIMHLVAWLKSSVLLCAEDRVMPSAGSLQELGRVLGVDPFLTDQAVLKLRVIWKGGKLCVSSKCKDMADFGELITGVLIGLWNCTLFSTPRWVGVGPSCRVMVAGWLTGLDSFMQFIASQGSMGDRILHYFKLTDQMRQFVVEAALSSYIIVSIQKELMVAAAVPMKALQLQAGAAQEMHCLCAIITDVWCMLSTACANDPHKLKQSSIRAGHASLGVLWHRIFLDLKKFPWCLCVGDIAADLKRLIAGTCADEPVSKRVHVLLDNGVCFSG